MTETLAITLPWPSRSLSPNARVHWRRLADVKKLAKRDAFYAAMSGRKEKIDAPTIKASVTFSPPDRRARDTDNMISSMKAAFDGIADAIGIDDSKWTLHIQPVAEPVKGGRVTVELEWMP